MYKILSTPNDTGLEIRLCEGTLTLTCSKRYLEQGLCGEVYPVTDPIVMEDYVLSDTPDNRMLILTEFTRRLYEITATIDNGWWEETTVEGFERWCEHGTDK